MDDGHVACVPHLPHGVTSLARGGKVVDVGRVDMPHTDTMEWLETWNESNEAGEDLVGGVGTFGYPWSDVSSKHVRIQTVTVQL
ncbi:hypothetical protein BHE74_00011243 [Ensete ventricosum]|uniref:Uncharacterized protein n=1 Tax=Ensete ventricosum TaxID=4639 RepID=A0A445MCT7_ENSVE|nr:hypothetical protein BHE74_00011243 [Ensete ventricosum]RZR72067.1 hypothetical protein BHM03_00010225 [Ensete ventricosum]